MSIFLFFCNIDVYVYLFMAVTFFLNGGREQPFENEDRILVPSPKVATYDLQPEMSCPEVGARVVDAIDSNKYDVAIVNFANPDMVGHTGDLNVSKNILYIYPFFNLLFFFKYKYSSFLTFVIFLLQTHRLLF